MYFPKLIIIIVGLLIYVQPTVPNAYSHDGKCHGRELDVKSTTPRITNDDLLRSRRRTLDELLRIFQINVDNQNRAIEGLQNAEHPGVSESRGIAQNSENLGNNGSEIEVIYPKLANNYQVYYLMDTKDPLKDQYKFQDDDYDETLNNAGMLKKNLNHNENEYKMNNKCNKEEEERNSANNKIDKDKQIEQTASADKGDHSEMYNPYETSNDHDKFGKNNRVSLSSYYIDSHGKLKPMTQTLNRHDEGTQGVPYERSKNLTNSLLSNNLGYIKIPKEYQVYNIESLNYLSNLYTTTTTESLHEVAISEADDLQAFKYPIGILRSTDLYNLTELPRYLTNSYSKLKDNLMDFGEQPASFTRDNSLSNLENLSQDQLETKRNNLSHEANYKLSKVEQENAAESSRRNNSVWRWPWSLTKRSTPFNAMHAIKLKTSSRLMKKGFGPSLPSDALGENRRELMMDAMLRRKEQEFPRGDNKLLDANENTDLDVSRNDATNLSALEDINISPLPNSLNLNDLHVRRKRIISYPRAKKNDKILKETHNKENYSSQKNLTKVIQNGEKVGSLKKSKNKSNNRPSQIYHRRRKRSMNSNSLAEYNTNEVGFDSKMPPEKPLSSAIEPGTHYAEQHNDTTIQSANLEKGNVFKSFERQDLLYANPLKIAPVSSFSLRRIRKREAAYPKYPYKREYYNRFERNHDFSEPNPDKHGYTIRSNNDRKNLKDTKSQTPHGSYDNLHKSNHKTYKISQTNSVRYSTRKPKSSSQFYSETDQDPRSYFRNNFPDQYQSSRLRENEKEKDLSSKSKSKFSESYQRNEKLYNSKKRKSMTNNKQSHQNGKFPSKDRKTGLHRFIHDDDVKNLDRLNINPSNWSTHLYDHYPDRQAWLDSIRSDNKTLAMGTSSNAPAPNDESGKISLEFRNEILNCTAYSTLENFLKSLRKNNQTKSSTSTMPATETEVIDIDFTTVEIPDYPYEDVESTTLTEFSITPDSSGKPEKENTTESQGSTESEPEYTFTTECYPTTESSESNGDVPSTEITDFEGFSSTETWNDDSASTTEYSQFDNLDRPDIGEDGVKLNITINANMRGNGTFKVRPGYFDDRYRRYIWPIPLDRDMENVENSKASENVSDNPDEDTDSLSDLTSGKLSSSIVKRVFRTVQNNPKLKVLWPSLRRNTLLQKSQNLPNFSALRNKDNEMQIQRSEQLMKQSLDILNDLVEQQLHSRSCLTLRPDLQEFYNLILQTKDEQKKSREKRENEKQKLFSENSKSRLDLSNTKATNDNNDQDDDEEVRKLLKAYEELPVEDQANNSDLSSKLFSELSHLRKLKDSEVQERRDHLHRKYHGRGSDDLELLEEFYTPEYSKLQKACKLYREKDNA